MNWYLQSAIYAVLPSQLNCFIYFGLYAVVMEVLMKHLGHTETYVAFIYTNVCRLYVIISNTEHFKKYEHLHGPI